MYHYRCQLSCGEQFYSATGSIGDDNRVVTDFYEFTPSPRSGSPLCLRRNPDKLYKGMPVSGSIGKKLRRDTSRLEHAASDHHVGELLRRRLAKYLKCPLDKVKVIGISLTPESSQGKTGGSATYSYICNVSRDKQALIAYGQVTDKVTLRLCEGDINPVSGGGIIGAVRLVDTIPLGKSVDTSSFRTLEKPVSELVQRRVARYFRCAPRMVTVSHFHIGPETTESDRRISKAKKKGLPRKGW
jgi:hypothetical protein